jgi:hypothetical protein
MKSLTQSEFRSQLETAILNEFVIEVNQPNQSQMDSQSIWNGRYQLLLNAIVSNEILPASIELQDIVDYLLENESKILFEYVENLPGMDLPLEKDKELNIEAVQNHGWLSSLFYNRDGRYKISITPESYCKFVFKEDNCFTLLAKDNYIHIKSNTNNVFDYDWTILSIESEDELDVKDLSFKNKRELIYYVKNYKDLYLLDGRDTKQMMDILLF